MKTFDEVTKALSICGRHPDCRGCPYENVSHPTEIGNTCKDIMHYDALYYMQDRIDKCQEANSPLTWDELKQMEGKPVWVETSCHKYWGLFNGVWDKHGKPHAMFIRGYQHQEKLSQFLFIRGLWQAYRKERGS